MPDKQELVAFIEKMRNAHALLAMNTCRSDEAVDLVAEANQIIKKSKQGSK